MTNGLPRLRAGIKDNAVPAVADSLGQRDLMRLGHHLSQDPVASRGERREIRIVIFRYHQYMRGCLRAYVTESNGSRRFEHAGCGDIARHDPAE
jgi:hypothetical protein